MTEIIFGLFGFVGLLIELLCLSDCIMGHLSLQTLSVFGSPLVRQYLDTHVSLLFGNNPLQLLHGFSLVPLVWMYLGFEDSWVWF